MNKKATYVVKEQKRIVDLVTRKFTDYYLTGGTALACYFEHRFSEDLDFFSQKYSSGLHRDIAAFIKKKTGFKYRLIEEEKRKQYLPMAIYEFEAGKKLILKVDFVKDSIPLFQPKNKNGIAAIDDLYYRKLMAVIGWKAGESKAGKALAGGRQKTKDLFDVYYLSAQVKPLSQWFPGYFDQNAYERLAAWYLGIPKQKAVMELLDLVTDCDTKLLFKHLDEEIIHKLNREYTGL